MDLLISNLKSRINTLGFIFAKVKEILQIQLQLDHNQTIELRSYSENEEFALISYDAMLFSDPDPCCPFNFSTINYYIGLKRRSTFFVINYVLPLIVINVIGTMPHP